MSKIPVTIITGFLGSGKTSLLNHLITAYPDKKFAIIENEFGETNIDSDLVLNIQNENIFELSNGCICCSLNDELYVILQNLINSNLHFNHLLIETTGIADPGTILASFVSDPFIKKQFQLDSVICLIDAKNVEIDLASEDILSKQISVADIILLNKIDLVEESKTNALFKVIREINSFAKIQKCTFSKPYEEILDTFSYDPLKIYPFIIGIENKQVKTENDKINHGMESFLFSTTEELDQSKLGMWLEAFLKFNQDSIYRIKGIVNISGFNNQVIIQSVHTQVQATVGKPWTIDETKLSKIVIIGKNLNQPAIKKNLMELSK